MTSGLADVQLEQYLARSTSSPQDLDVATLRRGASERSRLRSPGPRMHDVRELRIGHVAARLYRPTAGDIPIIIYLHGGGWTIGDLESHDRLCRRLAQRSGVGVLAIDYRLAPENPWPASVDDAVAALRWATSDPEELHPRPTAIAIGGDSAGGTLAALACLRLRDEHPEELPCLQVLLYANTDLTGRQPSMTERAQGWGLNANTIRFFNSQWVPDETKWADPRVSPLFAPDLSNLPRALIVTAEFDPLRDESEVFAARLLAAKVDVTLQRRAGLIHGFMTLDEVSPACAAAGDDVADALKALMNEDA